MFDLAHPVQRGRSEDIAGAACVLYPQCSKLIGNFVTALPILTPIKRRTLVMVQVIVMAFNCSLN